MAIALISAAVWFLLEEGRAPSRLRGGGTPSLHSTYPDAAAPSAAPEVSDTTAPLQPSCLSTNGAAEAVAAPAMSPRETRIFATPTNYVKKPGQMMLPNGQIITFKPPAAGEVRIVHGLNGTKYECDSEGNWKDITPKKLFADPIENHIVNLSIENGPFIPAFMIGYDTNAVMQALQRDVVINEDDTPDIVARKEAVAEVKGQILDYINQGGTYDGFIMEMATYVKAERKIKGRALSKISKLLKEGKIEEACAYRDEINKVLDDQQYSTLKLPKFMSDAMGK